MFAESGAVTATVYGKTVSGIPNYDLSENTAIKVRVGNTGEY